VKSILATHTQPAPPSETRTCCLQEQMHHGHATILRYQETVQLKEAKKILKPGRLANCSTERIFAETSALHHRETFSASGTRKSPAHPSTERQFLLQGTPLRRDSTANTMANEKPKDKPIMLVNGRHHQVLTSSRGHSKNMHKDDSMINCHQSCSRAQELATLA